MTEQDHLEELWELQWENASRLIFVVIVGVFGFMILQFASLHAESYNQESIETIKWVFSIMGSLMVAYMAIPWFRYGLENRDNVWKGACCWCSGGCDCRVFHLTG